MHSKRNYSNLINAGMIAVSILCAAFLFWKCRYGIADCDEAFYLTIPQRLLQGDALFYDEWNISQMYAFILYPLFHLFKRLHSDPAGILLAFRIIYVLVQIVSGAFIFFFLKRYSKFGAFLAALTFALYAPFNIMALSYNSICFSTLTVSLILMLRSPESSHPAILMIVSGLLFALSVVCQPYLAVLYAVYTFLFLVLLLPVFSRSHWIKRPPFLPLAIRSWCFFTVGILIVFLIFLLFVTRKHSLMSLLSCLPDVLYEPEHYKEDLLHRVWSYIIDVRYSSPWYLFILPSYIGLFILNLFFLRKKNVSRFIFLFASAVTVLFLLSFALNKPYVNFYMFPLNILTLFALLQLPDAINLRLFIHLWLPGMFYSFFTSCTSNQSFYASSSASIVALMGSILILIRTSGVIWSVSRIISKLCVAIPTIAVTLFMICLESYTRYSDVYWQPSISSQTEKIGFGCEKGLIVSSDSLNMYTETYLDSQEILTTFPNATSILNYTLEQWFYLDVPDLHIGSFSAWFPSVGEETVSRLIHYYEIDGHNIPDLIYLKRESLDTCLIFCKEFGYHQHMLSSGNIVLSR